MTGPGSGAPPAPRLPPATRPGRVRLQVADLDRSLAYYRDVLGLRALDRTGGEARLGPPEGDAVLVELAERTGAAPVPRGGRLGLYHFALLLPDRPALGAFLRHLLEDGIQPGAADHLVSEALYLQDPDNLGIEVYRDRPRDAWTWREGEVAMATDPLDARGLLEAAGDAPWEGMPAGAELGHVHLHVGDLEEAAAFYGDALGFEATNRSYPGALFVSAGGYHHHLGLNTWAPPRPPGEGDARLLEWELVVPIPAHVEAAAARLDAAGTSATRDGSSGIAAPDPWGTVVRVRPEAEGAE